MTKDEIIYYLNSPGNDGELFRRSDVIRRRCCGNDVHIRGIIEFSNHCVRNCLYCGLRRDNGAVTRYRMEEGEIVDTALQIASYGIRTVVLQSGDDFFYTRSMLCRIVERIKDSADVAVTLSIGERPFDDYRALKTAGVDRYLLKHETANEKLYRCLHPHQTLKQRLEILAFLRSIGYQIGAGNIVGLPGQTVDDLCAEIVLLRDLDPDMASVGLFIPQHVTPLSTAPQGIVSMALKVLALARIATGNSHMTVTTALVTADPDRGLIRGLRAGANVIMPDFTPDRYRMNYVIYDNKTRITLDAARASIHAAGRTMDRTRGDSLKIPEPPAAVHDP